MMGLISYKEENCYRIDTSELIGISGIARLEFQVAYQITKAAIDRGFEDKQREISKQSCTRHMLRMLHEAIERLSGGEV